MVSRTDIKISLSALPRITEPITIAVSLFCPNILNGSAKNSIIFTFPGGGYTREYYDIQIPGRENYSMARHLANDGHIVVSCDPIGVGESGTPSTSSGFDHELSASVNHAAVKQIIERIESGDLAENVPPISDLVVFGLGHSLGAGITLIQQAEFATYDAISLLGMTTPTSFMDQFKASKKALVGLNNIMQARQMLNAAESHIADSVAAPNLAHIRELYDYFIEPSVPDEIVLFDSEAAWKEMTRRQQIVGQAGVAAKSNFSKLRNAIRGARRFLPSGRRKKLRKLLRGVDVPVFLGCGEYDTSISPHRDAAAFASSGDVTLYVLPGSSHCHNYSNSRMFLFRRLSGWINETTHSSVAITN